MPHRASVPGAERQPGISSCPRIPDLWRREPIPSGTSCTGRFGSSTGPGVSRWPLPRDALQPSLPWGASTKDAHIFCVVTAMILNPTAPDEVNPLPGHEGPVALDHNV